MVFDICKNSNNAPILLIPRSLRYSFDNSGNEDFVRRLLTKAVAYVTDSSGGIPAAMIKLVYDSSDCNAILRLVNKTRFIC